jgi:hypothetical protein
MQPFRWTSVCPTFVQADDWQSQKYWHAAPGGS